MSGLPDMGVCPRVDQFLSEEGIGAAVAEVTAQECPVKMRILGIPDENVIHASPLEVFHHYGIDYEGIVAAAEILNS